MVIVILALSPPAAAQAEADAWATVGPDVAPAGSTVQLIFGLAAPDLVELQLNGRITCAVEDPTGAVTSPCDRSTGLLTVRIVNDGGREFVFEHVVPSTSLGTHIVRFEAVSDLTIPPTTYSAQATFEVVAAASDPSSGEGPGDAAGEPLQEGEGPGDGSSLVPGDDTGRWLVSSLAGVATVTVALVSRRWPFGGLFK